MLNLKVAAAVAAVLAAGTAAADVDVYISGASAQKNFWYADLANIAGCASTAISGNKWSGTATAPFTKAPDFSYVQCAAGSNSNGIPVGTTVRFHYSAELGSVWGIANALGSALPAGNPYPKSHLFLTNAGTCTPVAYTVASATFAGAGSTSCAGGQYDLYTTGGTDTIIGGNPAYVVSVVPDIDVSDLEPVKFQFADNWPIANNSNTWAPPLYKALGIQAAGTAPSLANLSTVQNSSHAQFVNGEVFAVIANFAGQTFAPTNLSSSSLAAIFQNDYSTWNQVPEVGSADTKAGGTPIALVRRDHGSGSQVTASITFTGTECGLLNDAGMAQDVGSGGVATIAGSTSAMRTIVNTTAASIGYLSLTGNVPGINETDNYTLISVDGAQPNSHNAAAGYYKFASQTWAYSPPTANALAATLITHAQTPTSIAATLGNETVTKGSDGRFTTAAGSNIGAYGLPGIGSNTASTANINTLSNIPVALRNNLGELCVVNAGQNGS
jgi:hypothetical protein